MQSRLLNKRLYNFGIDLMGCELEFISKMSPDAFHPGILSSEHSGMCYMQKTIAGDEKYIDSGSIAVNIFGTTDGSIRPSSLYRYGLEVVFGPVGIFESNTYLREVNNVTAPFVRVNKSCGTHYHFNSSNLSYREMSKLHIVFALFEPLLLLLNSHNRFNNRYCRQQSSAYLLDDFLDIKDEKDYRFLILGSKSSVEKHTLRKYGYETFYAGVNPRYLGFNAYSHYYRNTFELRYFSNLSLEHNINLLEINKLIINFALSHTINEIKELARNINTIIEPLAIVYLIHSHTASIETTNTIKTYINYLFDLLDINKNSPLYKYFSKYIRMNRAKEYTLMSSLYELYKFIVFGQNRMKSIHSICDDSFINKFSNETLKTRYVKIIGKLLSSPIIQKASIVTVLKKYHLNHISYVDEIPISLTKSSTLLAQTGSFGLRLSGNELFDIYHILFEYFGKLSSHSPNITQNILFFSAKERAVIRSIFLDIDKETCKWYKIN